LIPAAIVCVSQDTLQKHQRIGYKSPVFEIIHNGVDLRVFRPSDTDRVRMRKELGVGQEEVLVGFVARWDPYKDHENLFKALALLIEQGLIFRCALVGAGMDASNIPLINLVQQHKLQSHVILAGPRHDIPAVMNALDLHVLSSSAESFGNVVVEAMACGTPCVVTDVGAAALIVGDTGWVVPPGQPIALAAGIEQAFANLGEQKKHARGQRRRERMKRGFSLDAMVNSYIRLWKQVAK
jgi:glycosyltransferase involved in cell wall biosynthesis